MFTRKSLLASSLLHAIVLAAGAAAQTVEFGILPDSVPNGTEGNNLVHSVFFSSPRTYQMILDPSVLEQIPVGAVITSIAFRLDSLNAQAWPPAGSTPFSDFEIRIGKANRTAANMSNTFATNVVGGSDVLVRDGILAALPGVFGAGATAPNAEAWGPAMNLQSGFHYTGGGLVITIRHAGQFGGISPPVDGQDGAGVSSVFADGQGAASGSPLNAAAVVRIGFVRATERQNSGVNKVFVSEEYATAESSAGTESTPFASTPRTIGTIVAPSELDALGVGTSFTGYSLRNDESGPAPFNNPWPEADRNYGYWYLQMSHSQHPVGAMSQTIANNVGTDAKVVYNSTLTIPAQSLLADPSPWTFASPSPFSFEIPFTSAYEYRGGPLFMLIRTTGSGLANELRTDADQSGFLQSRVSADPLSATLPNSAVEIPFRLSADAAAIAPASNATFNGGSTTWQMLSETDAMYQTVISASELAHIPVGSLITSFSLRRYAGQGSSWPAQDVAALDYEVWLSTAASTPGTMSDTFAANEGADKLMVRDGALGVTAHSYPSAAVGASAYGPAIQFQRGFIYKGGDLCITVRSSGLPDSGTPYYDGVLASPLVGAKTWGQSTATEGVSTAAPIIKLGYIASAVNVGAETGGRRLFDSSRTHQMIYSAAALADIPAGAKITGMSFRNRITQQSVVYPEVDTVLSRFDVALSTAANTTASMSTIIAENEGDDRIDARTGPLTIPAGMLRDSPISPANDADEFNYFIEFPQPFFYRGGDLAVTIRSESPLPSLGGADVATTSSSALATMRQDGTTADAVSLGTYVAPFIIRFAYTPPSFCPADLNKDGIVSDDDFQIFVLSYNILDCHSSSMPVGCPADLNYDQVVDDADFQIFVVAYNELLCP